jgi:hypothetical protein
MQDISRQKEDNTIHKYVALMATINETEKRLGLADLIFLSLNLFMMLFTIHFISSLLQRTFSALSSIELLLILFCLVIGMAICVYWAAYAIRIQLKLKLRYFQARFLERKMDCTGECIFSDESVFFDPETRQIDSPDKKETLLYPTEGLTRMDGFIGAAKPRYFSWFMPILFFAMYWVIFIWIIIKVAL